MFLATEKCSHEAEIQEHQFSLVQALSFIDALGVTSCGKTRPLGRYTLVK